MKARLARLKRLERMRLVARDAAASEAARTEQARAQLVALADRAERLALDYAARCEATTGAELAALGQFATGLHAVHAATMRDAGAARDAADVTLAVLGEAERRRSAVRDRISAQARLLSRQEIESALTPVRRSGTGIE